MSQRLERVTGWSAGLELVAVLVVLPLLLAVVNPEAALPLVWSDSWVYHAQYHDVPGHLTHFSKPYYTTRLSITLPGWIAYRFFPPIAANYLLHYAVYLLGTGSLYCILRTTVNHRTGIIGATILGGQYFYQLAVCTDYADGYGMGYFLLATALCVHAGVAAAWPVWLVAAGAVLGALVTANLTYGVLVPFAVVPGLLLTMDRKRSRWAIGALCGLAGIALWFVAMGAISRSCGGPRWVLQPALIAMRWARTQFTTHPDYLPLSTWWISSVWLYLPFAASVGAFFAFLPWVRRIQSEWTALRYWYQLQILILFAVCVTLHLAHGRTTYFLQFWFYAGPLLLPATILALASQWGGWLTDLSTGAYRWTVAFAVVLAVVVALIPPCTNDIEPFRQGHWVAYCVQSPAERVVFLVLIGTVVTAVLLPSLIQKPVVGFVAVLLLAMVNWGVRSWSPARPWELCDRGQAFPLIHQSMAAVRELDPTYKAYYWFDGTTDDARFLALIPWTHCWWQVINPEFPRLKATGQTCLLPGIGAPAPGMRVLLLTRDGNDLSRARRVIESAGLRVQLLGERTVRASDELHIFHFAVEARSGMHEPDPDATALRR